MNKLVELRVCLRQTPSGVATSWTSGGPGLSARHRPRPRRRSALRTIAPGSSSCAVGSTSTCSNVLIAVHASVSFRAAFVCRALRPPRVSFSARIGFPLVDLPYLGNRALAGSKGRNKKLRPTAETASRAQQPTASRRARRSGPKSGTSRPRRTVRRTRESSARRRCSSRRFRAWWSIGFGRGTRCGRRAWRARP